MRRYQVELKRRKMFISIHSPAKDETLELAYTPRNLLFQSTHPRRMRQRQMTQFIEKRMEDIEVF